MEQKKIWAFGGGKGGVGKSFVAGNLGILLAQNGHTVIPKSARPHRIEENADIFDFKLTEDQMKMLDELEEGLRFCPDPLGLP